MEILIRTTPTPMGPVPIDIKAIRKELLTTLGLGGEK